MKFKTIGGMAAVALSSLIASNALAQAEKKEEAPAPPVVRPGVRADRLADLTLVLKLSDEQKAKIKPVLEEEAQQIKALREQRSLPFQERGAKSREIRKNADEKIRAVLTPEQTERYNKMRGLGPDGKPAAPIAPPAPGKK